MICANCQRRMNVDTVNMIDQCLGCGATPFPEWVDSGSGREVMETARLEALAFGFDWESSDSESER